MTLKTSLADQLDTWLRHGPRTRIVKSTDGAVFEVDTTDLIQRYLYLFGVWEPHMTAWLRHRLRQVTAWSM
jgi:hypothetical protein